jgi:hypothetical protein
MILIMDCTGFGGFFEERLPVNGQARWCDRAHKPPGSVRLAKNVAGGGTAEKERPERGTGKRG